MRVSIPGSVAVHDLSRPEREAVDALALRLAEAYPAPDAAPLLGEARRLGFSHLPADLVRFLERFQRTEFAAAVAVTGLGVDDAAIGPTPSHWRAQPDRRSTFREEVFLVLLGSILGDVFGWATLQEGRLVHNVLPIASQEEEQSGHGSSTTLAWHTEDGFHPHRCDYLGLLSLRNDERVPTTLAAVDAVALTPEQRWTLAEPRFVIRPDNEHLHQHVREGAEIDRVAARRLEAWRNPAPVPVLFGDPARPYLRIDPFFMSSLPGDEQAAAALRAIVDQLEAAIEDVVLEPGTVCFIDNYRAVHGRAPFRARYDGRDRWLKKIVVTRDLRKSRAARERAEARVVAPAVLSGGW